MAEGTMAGGATDEAFSNWASASPPGKPRLRRRQGPALPRAVHRLCWLWDAACLSALAVHSRRAGSGGAGAVGASSEGHRTSSRSQRAPPPHFERGRDRLCLKEIAAQQVRTRLGSGMWKYDSEQLLQRAASAARRAPARRAARGGARRVGAEPRAPGGRGRGARTEPEAAGPAVRPIPSQPDELSR